MSVLKQPSRLRVISLSAGSLLCVLLASVLAPHGAPNGLVKTRPSVELRASTTLITYPCPPGAYSGTRSCPSTADLQVALTAITKAFNKQSVFVYTATGGRVVGEGSKATWNLSEAGPGIYIATVEVQDNKKHRAVSSVIVTIANCADCVFSELCPTIVVTCYDQVTAGTPSTCKAVVRPWLDLFTLEWSVHDSNGENLAARISRRDPYISIRTTGLGGLNVIATVEVKGVEGRCGWRTASGSTVVKR